MIKLCKSLGASRVREEGGERLADERTVRRSDEETREEDPCAKMGEVGGVSAGLWSSGFFVVVVGVFYLGPVDFISVF